jgi:3D-(3,5/4)-trihydroxycyclohexane-1,2-dione acylhydrolase (decyclizing)
VWTPRRAHARRGRTRGGGGAPGGEEAGLIIAGGGVLYSGDRSAAALPKSTGIPVMRNAGGKSSLPHDHPLNMGSVGVTGTSAANALAEEADLVLAVGSRLQDFTTGSWALFKNDGTGSSASTRSLRCRQAPRAAARRRRARSARSPVRGAGRAGGAGALDGEGRQRQGAWEGCKRQGDRADQCAAAVGRAGDRRGAARLRLGGDIRDGLRLGRPAGRTAQALAGRRAGQLPSRIRLLCMGYEIAGGLGVKLAKPDARRRRDGRRRLLHDDEFGDRHAR